MQDRGAYLEQRIVLSFFVSSGRAFVNGIICVRCVLLSMMRGLGWWRAAALRVGSPAGRNARARCSGPPCTTPPTALRVQGPTLRDAALANGGDGSPPVAPQFLHQPQPPDCLAMHVTLTPAAASGFPSSAAAQSAPWSQAVNS